MRCTRGGRVALTQGREIPCGLRAAPARSTSVSPRGSRYDPEVMRRVMLLAVALHGTGCLSSRYSVRADELRHLAAQPPEARWQRVRVVQGIGGDEAPPAAAVPVVGIDPALLVVGLASSPGRSIARVQPPPPRATGSAGRGSRGGGGGGQGAAWVVAAVVVAAAAGALVLAGIEGRALRRLGRDAPRRAGLPRHPGRDHGGAALAAHPRARRARLGRVGLRGLAPALRASGARAPRPGGLHAPERGHRGGDPGGRPRQRPRGPLGGGRSSAASPSRSSAWGCSPTSPRAAPRPSCAWASRRR